MTVIIVISRNEATRDLMGISLPLNGIEMTNKKYMKIALVHDYLREYGGAERVVETLHEMWPAAPLYTSFVDWGNLGDQGYRFKNWDIRTIPSPLIPGISWIPGILALQDLTLRKFHSPLRFLAPWIWSSFSAKGGSASGRDLSEYDVVISSSGWFMCRGVALGRSGKSPAFAEATAGKGESGGNNNLSVSGRKPLHICYIHHPPRNLYGYATGSSLQKYWPVRVYATIVNFFLRQYDYRSAQAVDYFVANSQETARRVTKFYRRDSVVIYPPVEVGSNPPQPPLKLRGGVGGVMKREYFLSVGRLTYSKRVDLAIRACNQLKLPLKIVGRGSEETWLRSISGPTIEFIGGVSDTELAELYAGAKALIFCALDEDFGMVPVEAMSHGTPVIALSQGGVKETVVDGKTGVLFNEPSVTSLVAALGKFGKLGESGKIRDNCISQARKFSKGRFKKELTVIVKNVYNNLN